MMIMSVVFEAKIVPAEWTMMLLLLLFLFQPRNVQITTDPIETTTLLYIS